MVADCSDARLWIDWGAAKDRDAAGRSADCMILGHVPVIRRLGAGSHPRAAVRAAASRQLASALAWPEGYRRPCLEVLLRRLLEDLEESTQDRITIVVLR